MAEPKEYLRFTVPQRLEHWVLFLSFTLLAITGIPQKFAGYGWAETAIGMMGGIEIVRTIHHVSAIVLVLVSIYHIIAVAYKVFVLRVRWTMFPRLDDVFDGLDAIRYNIGLTKEQPKLGRYNFIEKVEYWALIWGIIVMAITGFAMWNPITFTRFFPGDLIPAAKAAHGAEALLAVLAVIIWHFYSVHIKEFSRAMFNGKVNQHQMEEDHALELAQIEQGKSDVRPAPEVIKKRERVFIPIATFASVAMLLALYFAATYQVGTLETVARRPLATVPIYLPITATPTLVPGAAPTGVAAAVPLPADHAGRTTCIACHGNGVGPALPPDHAGRTDATCAACHKPAGQAAPTAAPGSNAAPTSAPAAGGLQPLPADHAGRTTCLACHANGVGPALPSDHAGRTDATCSTCHQVASAPAVQPMGASTPGSATPTPLTPAPAAGSMSLPADHAGRTVCLGCHANGVGPAVPADHAGRTDDTCTTCHKVGSAPASQSTATPAVGAAPTAAPTSSSASGPMPQPADHAGRTTCLSCHANLSDPALPADHAGRTDSMCAACHKAP